MTIPERLWRVMRGHLIDALEGDPLLEKRAEADAWEELAGILRRPELPAGEQAAAAPGDSADAGAPLDQARTPIQASYRLLGLSPGATLEDADTALDMQLEQLRPEQYPPGSEVRRAVEARRSALQAAYEKVRDHLNPTEARFDHLEFD